MDTKAKVLIVDDEESLCDVLSDTLINEGYDVTKTYDGQTAINLISSNEYDAAIIDLLLPQKNGMDILRHAQNEKKTLKIIMATGYGEISTAVEAINLGAFDFLQKPFNIANLKIILQRALELKKEEDKHKPARENKIETEISVEKKAEISDDIPKEFNLSPEELEKRKILAMLKETNWNKSKTADMLDMPLKTLYSKIKAYGLKP